MIVDCCCQCRSGAWLYKSCSLYCTFSNNVNCRFMRLIKS